MMNYYGLNEQAKILAIGHSQTVLGIDSNILESRLGYSVAKYAIAGANVLDRYWMIKHYMELNPHVEIIIYGVDARLFDSEGLSSASYTLFLPFMDNKIMAEYLRSQASNEEYFVSKFIRTARFRDQTLNISLRGLLDKSENEKTGRVRIQNYKSYLEKEKVQKVRITPESIKCFRTTMKYLAERKIKVFLVNIPVIDLLNQIDEPNQEKALQIFFDIHEQYKNIHFFNYSPEFEKKHHLFFDLRHLNETGKRVLTNKFSLDMINILYGSHWRTGTNWHDCKKH